MHDRPHRVDGPADTPAPPGFFAIGAFLFFGAAMATLAAITLFWPGTALDHIWRLNPGAHQQLAPLGRTVAVLFLVLGGALGLSGFGWFRRRRWGWRLATAIIAIQLAGDVGQSIRGNWKRAAVGLVIAGALLLFLMRPAIKRSFR